MIMIGRAGARATWVVIVLVLCASRCPTECTVWKLEEVSVKMTLSLSGQVDPLGLVQKRVRGPGLWGAASRGESTNTGLIRNLGQVAI